MAQPGPSGTHVPLRPSLWALPPHLPPNLPSPSAKHRHICVAAGRATVAQTSLIGARGRRFTTQVSLSLRVVTDWRWMPEHPSLHLICKGHGYVDAISAGSKRTERKKNGESAFDGRILRRLVSISMQFAPGSRPRTASAVERLFNVWFLAIAPGPTIFRVHLEAVNNGHVRWLEKPQQAFRSLICEQKPRTLSRPAAL